MIPNPVIGRIFDTDYLIIKTIERVQGFPRQVWRVVLEWKRRIVVL